MHFVLLIEDDAGRVEWFKKRTLPGVRIIHARSAGLALGMLRRDQYHAILLDNDPRGVMFVLYKEADYRIFKEVLKERDIPFREISGAN